MSLSGDSERAIWIYLVDEELVLARACHHLGLRLHEVLEVTLEEREHQVKLVVGQDQILQLVWCDTCVDSQARSH